MQKQIFYDMFFQKGFKQNGIKIIMETLICGNNIEILKNMESKSVDLITTDPPYNSGSDYSTPDGIVQFTDKFDSMESYIGFLRPVLEECHRLLKDTGSIYVHVDQTASHYLKIELDRIFGIEQFRNDIIWCYSWASAARKCFTRKHDNILFYARGQNNTFNRDAVTVAHRRPVRPGEGLASPMTAADADRINARGKFCEDWWDDIMQAFRKPAERLQNQSYPTAKPVKLLERIIKASSNEGDTVLDPFMGSGTAMAVSKQLGRKYVGIDINSKAVDIAEQRISKLISITKPTTTSLLRKIDTN